MARLTKVVLTGALLLACAASTPYQAVGNVVTKARADQLSFAAEYQDKGLAFQGTLQSKGVKASTGVGIDVAGYHAIQARRINVNYGYAFLGEGSAEDKRVLCLFEPEDLKQLAPIKVGQTVKLTGLFSKFVGEQSQSTPVFWGCSVID